jgi:hypothetical protein
MRQQVFEAYEQGYLDGLRQAHAELLEGSLPDALGEEMAQPEVQHHPVYREGFSEGLRDGTEVLIAIGKTSRPR